MTVKDVFFTPSDWLSRPIHVTLIGAGGTGSEMLDAFARLHGTLLALGHPHGFHVTVFDHDDVSETNVLRQRFWPGDIGHNKAVLQVQRLNTMLGLQWTGRPVAFTPELLSRDSQIDLLVTCVDRASVRAELAKADFGAYARTGLWLDTGNSANRGQVVLGRLPGAIGQRTRDGYTLPHVLDLYPEIATMPDDDSPSCSAAESLAAQEWGINRLIADVAGNLLWQILRHGQTDHHGAFVQLQPITVSPMPIDPVFWEGMGFVSDTLAMPA